MILDLGDDAKEYGRQALRAFEAAGGDQLVQQAEAKPDLRESLAGPALAELGAWGLEPPPPAPERIAKPTALDVDGLIVVADTRPAGVVAGLQCRWATASLDGVRSKMV